MLISCLHDMFLFAAFSNAQGDDLTNVYIEQYNVHRALPTRGIEFVLSAA